MENFESQKIMLFCKNIPCYIFWKDNKLRYQGGNEQFLQAIGLNSPQDVVGRTDYDFPWAPDAKSYRSSDLLILEGKELLSSRELRWNINGPRYLIVNKLPLKDEKGNIIGILGIHQDVTFGYMNQTESGKVIPPYNDLNAINPLQQNEIELFSTIKNILKVALTYREIECLSLWLSGYSIKESSYWLGISQKSIEAYRKHVKDKMGLYHKSQLIDLMQSEGTFHLFLALSKVIKQKSKKT